MSEVLILVMSSLIMCSVLGIILALLFKGKRKNKVKAPMTLSSSGFVTMPSKGCPAGWSAAVGTVYDLWPKPGTKECIQYSGCKWAGLTKSLSAGPLSSKGPCRPGAKPMDGGNGTVYCRWPEEKIRSWSLGSTWDKKPELDKKKLEIAVEGGNGKTVEINMLDVCNDGDCGGCCGKNTGAGKYPLIDIEKHPASALLGFDISSSTFDINNVSLPSAKGKRPGVPEDSVVALCYRVKGEAVKPV